MKGELERRPESKNVSKQVRPTSMYSKPVLALQSFTKGKEYQENLAFQKATEQYLKTLIYDPNYFQAYCNMGSCYRAQGKYLEARSMYLKAINIKNDDSISHYNLANTLRIIGNYQDSIKHYDFVIKVAEKGSASKGELYKNSLINLGICYKQAQTYEKSIECFEKARLLDPKDQSIIFNEAMTYMAILQNINTDIFYELAKEKAEKTQSLLKQILRLNSGNEMALLKLLRVSTILDRSNKNLKIVVNKLKGMLENQGSRLDKEINQELGYVLNLLKEYQKSALHYQESIVNPKKTVNIYDNSNSYPSEKSLEMTEEGLIAMVNEDKITEVNQIISKMTQDRISKHVLELAIQLKQFQMHPKAEEYLNKAEEIYNQYFMVDNQEIADQKVSIEAHKLIGKLLSLQNNFKKSIRHFQYISSQLKSSNEITKVRSSLGSDYEALGDNEKALEQYRLALAEEPENYEIIYNIGCCLNDEGNQQESIKYFQKFLNLVRKDNRIYLPTKNLYIADCLITMASIAFEKPDEFNLHQNAWVAYKQSKEGDNEGNLDLDENKCLNFCLRWADLLEDKITTFVDKTSQEFKSAKETLLETYLQLLQIQICPDRDAILNNCAIIYYEEKLYVNALGNMNQVVFPSGLSLNSLALTYFHLGQHIMATNTIALAVQKESNDELIQFNRQIMDWVYGLKKQGRLQRLLDNQDENLIIARWQYGALLFDELSQNLKDVQNTEEIHQIIEKFLEEEYTHIFLSETDQIKFNHLHQLLKTRTEKPIIASISDQIISKCFITSQNVEQDFKWILNSLLSLDHAPQALTQSLLSLFVYFNKEKQLLIHAILSQFCAKKGEIVKLDLDLKISISQQQLAKEFHFESIEDIVINFCSWECELETKMAILIETVQQFYYQSKFRNPLEIQYQFPRHNQVDQCNSTFNRILSIVYGVFKIKSSHSLLGANTTEMKNQIMEKMLTDFETQMQSSFHKFKLFINQNLTVAIIYANFISKEECFKFVHNLQKQCSNSKLHQFYQEVDELTLILNEILTIKCVWIEKRPLMTAVQSLLRTPVSLYHQSIIEIDSDLDIIKESSQKARQIIQKIEEFKT